MLIILDVKELPCHFSSTPLSAIIHSKEKSKFSLALIGKPLILDPNPNPNPSSKLTLTLIPTMLVHTVLELKRYSKVQLYQPSFCTQ